MDLYHFSQNFSLKKVSARGQGSVLGPLLNVYGLKFPFSFGVYDKFDYSIPKQPVIKLSNIFWPQKGTVTRLNLCNFILRV